MGSTSAFGLCRSASEEAVTGRWPSRPVLVRQSLERLESEWGRYFVRIHRKHLVQLNMLEGIKVDSVHVDGTWLPLSKRRREAFLQRIGKDRIW